MAIIINDFNVDFNYISHDSDSLFDFCICNHLIICISLLCIFPYYSLHCIFSHLHRSLFSDHAFVKSFHQQPFSFLSIYDLIEITFDFFVYRLSPCTIIVAIISALILSPSSLSFLDWSAFDRLLSTEKLKFSITISLRLAMLLSGPSRTKKLSAPWLDETI